MEDYLRTITENILLIILFVFVAYQIKNPNMNILAVMMRNKRRYRYWRICITKQPKTNGFKVYCSKKYRESLLFLLLLVFIFFIFPASHFKSSYKVIAVIGFSVLLILLIIEVRKEAAEHLKKTRTMKVKKEIAAEKEKENMFKEKYLFIMDQLQNSGKIFIYDIEKDNPYIGFGTHDEKVDFDKYIFTTLIDKGYDLYSTLGKPDREIFIFTKSV